MEVIDWILVLCGIFVIIPSLIWTVFSLCVIMLLWGAMKDTPISEEDLHETLWKEDR